MRTKRLLLVLAVLILAALACTAPGQAPVTVVVTVVGSQAGGGQPADVTTATTGESTEASAQVSSDVKIQAKATTQVAIRKHPGPGCEIIGYVEKDEVVNFLLRTDFEPHWYQTDKLGVDNLGWVYYEYFTLLQEDILPRVPEKGCLYCGDGVCSADIGEACDVCTADCGACPRCGDGVVNQASEECDGSASTCSVKGSKCNNRCKCVEPPTPEPTKPFCGDGKVNQRSEQCDGSNAGCTPGKECTANCTCQWPPPD